MTIYVVFRVREGQLSPTVQSVVGTLEAARPVRPFGPYAAAIAAWAAAHPDVRCGADEYLRMEPWSSCSRRMQAAAKALPAWVLPVERQP